jgi:hypothetical protein
MAINAGEAQFELTPDSVIATVRCPPHQRAAFQKRLPVALWVSLPGITNFARSQTNCHCAIAYVLLLKDTRNNREFRKLEPFAPRNGQGIFVVCACFGRLIE